MWDNDGSGNLDFEEVETVMKKYKEGQEKEAINTGMLSFMNKLFLMHINNVHTSFKIPTKVMKPE